MDSPLPFTNGKGSLYCWYLRTTGELCMSVPSPRIRWHQPCQKDTGNSDVRNCNGLKLQIGESSSDVPQQQLSVRAVLWLEIFNGQSTET
ncbi:hypothetical protein MPTK1_3g02000 [Marchantia polymorpha subsp. ruderalis]|uniref:Uncharacterized protein n=2 Tax=Marchantia polymorpha TaxID=3197 RepID=A0AAF6AWH2_MARPO|nr:hypothetical protein MARPO_0007s0189 [Marchantia polymorpha]BBN04106.1 hypothetical protein Mp_3g02000 [Marchantia polymorpha subsp. ruderalis]|eukprot:PTQ47793.1 hypothetical protein MARPO_0007s0189 [Marchantia polymorpha]